MEKYTTLEKIDKLIKDKASTDVIEKEQSKTIISNDAYAIIDILIQSLENLRMGKG